MADPEARIAADVQAITDGLNGGWSLEASEVETQKHGESVDAEWKERFAALDRLLALLKEHDERIKSLEREATSVACAVECDGGPHCQAAPHVHGCFADKGNCDHPSEHGTSTTSEFGSLPDPVSSASEASRLLTEQDADALLIANALGKDNPGELRTSATEALKRLAAALVARDAEVQEAARILDGLLKEHDAELVARDAELAEAREIVEQLRRHGGDWIVEAAKRDRAALEAEVTQLRAAVEAIVNFAVDPDDSPAYCFAEVRYIAREVLAAGVVPPEQAPRKTENEVADRTKEPSESALRNQSERKESEL